jgi:hypothetical protein
LLPPSSGIITLMMEAARTSETLVNFYQTTWRYNPKDSHLRTHRHENLKSYFLGLLNQYYNVVEAGSIHSIMKSVAAFL